MPADVPLAKPPAKPGLLPVSPFSPVRTRLQLVRPVSANSDGPRAPFSLRRESLGASRFRRPLEAPPVFQDTAALVAERQPDHPVLCVWPDELKRCAAEFIQGFAGTPLYAVKCNPEPFVLQALFEAGITGFDVASQDEVELVHGLFGDRAGMLFNNPAKARHAIRASANHYGIRCFTVDHASELDKVIEETRGRVDEVLIAVRLAATSSAARYALSTKFGAAPDVAVDLLAQAEAAGLRVGLSFHVGSQCLDPQAFVATLSLCREILRRSGATLDLLNIGGGFPASYPGDHVPELQDYLNAAALSRRVLGLGGDCAILCEPGRALVASSARVIMQVLLRKDGTLYCNDGIYGNLQELRSAAERRPARRIEASGRVSVGTAPFRIYGPTCDSDDVLGAPLLLPPDIQEGDWIEVGMMGAYSSATRTGFNGFATHSMVQIPGMPG